MKAIKTIFKICYILLLFITISFPIIFIIFGLEDNPNVLREKQITVQDMERVERLVRANDPRKLKIGEIKSVTLSEREINLFFDYAFAQSEMTRNIAAKAKLKSNLSVTYFTVALPENRFGNYINVTAFLSQVSNDIKIKKLKVGKLSFPGWFFKPLFWVVNKFLQGSEEYRIVKNGSQAIKKVHFEKKSLTIVYQWRPEILDQIQARGRDLLIPAGEKERWLAYNDKLYTISNSLKGRKILTIKFLQPLFQLAHERTLRGNDAVAENKILILTFAMFGTGSNMDRVLKFLEIDGALRPRHVKLTLLGREDLAKHFLLSAALTLSGGGDLANVMGVYKEYGDSKGGSGFSFADLAADRAGMKFAEIAIGSDFQAKAIQQRMSRIESETDFMPSVDRLPEGIQSYGQLDLDEATVQIIEKEIDRRIKKCPIYQ